MPQTILGSEWFDENEAAAALELPLDIVHRFFDAMIADKRTPVAYYKGAGTPLLNGYTIMALKGRAQQEQPQKQPARKRPQKQG